MVTWTLVQTTVCPHSFSYSHPPIMNKLSHINRVSILGSFPIVGSYCVSMWRTAVKSFWRTTVHEILYYYLESSQVQMLFVCDQLENNEEMLQSLNIVQKCGQTGQKQCCIDYLITKWGSLPCLFWCQHLWLCEEVEALLQGEVSCSSCFTQRAGVLLVLQLLGAHQDVLLQTLVVFPHQLQECVFREVCQCVLCRGVEGWRKTMLVCWTLFLS